jgi:hypothetical protein
MRGLSLSLLFSFLLDMSRDLSSARNHFARATCCQDIHILRGWLEKGITMVYGVGVGK